MRLENKTAVIATSGGSIGLECARKLEEEGAKVIILDLDHAEAENLSSSDTRCVVPVNCFYDEAEVEEKLKKASEAFAPVDIVVTNLISKPSDCAWNEITEEEAHRIFDEIMTGVQTVLKFTVPTMIERSSGSIVIIENLAGRTGVKGANVITSAAYAGLSGMIRNMATVYGKNMITVNGVAVGPIEGQYFEPEAAKNLRPELGKTGTGEDVANAVMYLADPEVFWNEGEIVDLNGGRFAV